MLKWFDAYHQAGYKPIPLVKNEKVPVSANWQNSWSVSRWRNYFNENYNMGILLGEIVDVEGDSADANQFIEDLIGNIPHPKFKSFKSIHHLFLSPDRNLRIVKHEKIEFRGYGHQSVVPPSSHLEGNQYKWCKDSITKPPQMPKHLLDFYKSIKKQEPPRLKEDKEGYTKATCCCCLNQFFIHRKRLSLESKAFKQRNSGWNCHKCRKFDVREMCRNIRKQSKNDQIFHAS